MLEHKLAILKGTGRNGKGVLYGAINNALGEYGGTAEPDLFMHREDAHPTGEMDLRGLRFVVVSESGIPISPLRLGCHSPDKASRANDEHQPPDTEDKPEPDRHCRITSHSEEGTSQDLIHSLTTQPATPSHLSRAQRRPSAVAAQTILTIRGMPSVSTSSTFRWS